MTSDKLLTQASRLLAKRQFQKTISLMEPKILEYRENELYFKLLGLAYLYLGDYGGAESYVKRARQISDFDPEIELAVAALALRRREFTRALRIWLDIRSSHPENNTAKRCLEMAKKAGTTHSNETLLEKKRFESFLPALPRHFPMGWVIFLGILILSIGTGIVIYPNISNHFPAAPAARPRIAAVTLEEGVDLITYQGEFRNYLSNEEIRSIFNRGKDYFAEYRDNLAIREMNRLLLSNADPFVKDRASLLISYAKAPGFDDFRDNITLEALRQDPMIHNNQFVLWGGRIANLNITETQIFFDFLVGYQNSQVLEGIVPVSLDFPVILENGQAIELIGQVLALEDQSFRIQGIAVHKIAPGPN